MGVRVISICRLNRGHHQIQFLVQCHSANKPNFILPIVRGLWGSLEVSRLGGSDVIISPQLSAVPPVYLPPNAIQCNRLFGSLTSQLNDGVR